MTWEPPPLICQKCGHSVALHVWRCCTCDAPRGIGTHPAPCPNGHRDFSWLDCPERALSKPPKAAGGRNE